MRTKQPEILKQYVREDGVKVTVYAEKKTKRRSWMRGENFCGIVQRTDDFAGGMMVPFSRKPGKI